MTKKQGVRAVVFLAVLIGIVLCLDGVSRLSPDSAHISRRFRELYTDAADTWDGILLGTSYTDRAWAAPVAWEEQGMAVYPMSTDGQPFVLIPDIIEEVLKYQDISFAVVELHGLTSEALYTDAAKIHRVTDNMKWSSNRAQAIERALSFMSEWSPEALGSDSVGMLRLSCYLPLIQFHSKLTEEGMDSLVLRLGETKQKGTYEAEQSVKTGEIHLAAHENCPKITEPQKELMDAVFACARENGIRLLFLNLATEQSQESYQEELNAAARYARENGYPVLNCNDEEVMVRSGIDENTDYYDTGHMNALGAHKFTGFVASWITENLELEDHRGDNRYQSWEDAADYYDNWYQNALADIAGRLAG